MTERLPHAATNVADLFPEIWQACQSLGEACATARPLDAQTRRLIKLALAFGATSEGATHTRVRRALDAGIGAETLTQIAMPAIPTPDIPRAGAALTRIEDITDPISTRTAKRALRF